MMQWTDNSTNKVLNTIGHMDNRLDIVTKACLNKAKQIFLTKVSAAENTPRAPYALARLGSWANGINLGKPPSRTPRVVEKHLLLIVDTVLLLTPLRKQLKLFTTLDWPRVRTHTVALTIDIIMRVCSAAESATRLSIPSLYCRPFLFPC